MAFIAISQNLDMGGRDESVAGAGPSAGKGLMLVFVGRFVPLLIGVRQLFKALW